MSFEAEDRVICINGDMSKSVVTGIPQSAFDFPGGFIREGEVYHVYQVVEMQGDRQQLRLTGYPVYDADGRLGGWDSSRFRRYRVADVTNSAVEFASQAREERTGG